MNKQTHFQDLIIELENAIQIKRSTKNEQNGLDNEVLAWISVYRNGSEEFKGLAKKWLTTFLVNSGFVKNKRSIIY